MAVATAPSDAAEEGTLQEDTAALHAAEDGQPSSGSAPSGDGPLRTPHKRRAFPSILAELGLKVLEDGVLFPESRKMVLTRRREMRQLAIERGEDVEMRIVPHSEEQLKKRKQRKRPSYKGGGVQLDEVESELFYAAHQGSVESCKSALEEGVNVNVRTNADLDGVGTAATALHVASMRGHEDVVKELLLARADAVATSGRGETPVQIATRLGHVEVVRILRNTGAVPAHVEGTTQLMDKMPSGWDENKRRKLHSALKPLPTLPPPPPPPPSEQNATAPCGQAAIEDQSSKPPHVRGKKINGKGKSASDDGAGNERREPKRHPLRVGKGKKGSGKGKKGNGKGKKGKGSEPAGVWAEE